MNVCDNIAVVPRLLNWERERIERRALELMDLIGLDHGQYGRKYPHELSGGEAQRIGVARALAANPPILLMDEPFGAVDDATRNDLQGMLLDIWGEAGFTVVLVTHRLTGLDHLGLESAEYLGDPDFVDVPDLFLRAAREGFATVGLSWFAISLFGMLPYLLTDTFNGPTDAFFETAAGFTTWCPLLAVSLRMATAARAAVQPSAAERTIWRANFSRRSPIA